MFSKNSYKRNRSALSGVRWTGLSAVYTALLSLSQIPILARFLSPADFGLMAIVMSVMVFAQMFSDVGVSNAIIFKKDISEEQLSSLYWLNVGSSGVIALILFIVGYGVAMYYGHPKLHGLLSVTACSLFISSLGLQFRVLAQKKLQFNKLAMIEMLGATIGFIVVVSLVWLNYGIYAVVFGGLVTAISSAALSWFFLSDGWCPSLVFKWKEIKSFLKFGAYVVGNDLANAINGQVDVFLGANFLSASALGVFNLPKTLALRIQFLVNPIITKVGLPVMAREQSNLAKLKEIYLQTLNLTASINFPIYITIFLFAEPIVAVVFGEQWMNAVPLLKVLAIWASIRSTGNPIGSLLLARGRADVSFRWNLALLFFIPPVLWVGCHYDAVGMAYALLLTQVILFFPAWYFLIRPMCGASFFSVVRQFIKPLLVSVFVMVPVAYFIGDMSLITQFISAGIACGVSLIILLLLNMPNGKKIDLIKS